MEQRRRALYKKIAIGLGIGIAYYLFVTLTGWAIPCPLYAITGLYCPGCGITRMFISLLSLEFAQAFHNNAVVCVLLLPAIGFSIMKAIQYVKTGQVTYKRWEGVLVFLALLLTLGFGVIRNLPIGTQFQPLPY